MEHSLARNKLQIFVAALFNDHVESVCRIQMVMNDDDDTHKRWESVRNSLAPRTVEILRVDLFIFGSLLNALARRNLSRRVLLLSST